MALMRHRLLLQPRVAAVGANPPNVALEDGSATLQPGGRPSGRWRIVPSPAPRPTGYFDRRATRIRYRRATSLAASPLAWHVSQ